MTGLPVPVRGVAGRYAGLAALAAAGLGEPPEDRGRQIRVDWPGKPRPKPASGL
ncbi:hypothetical protein NRK68_23710 [Streptomyces yangpuensis]|uniref:Uncharacterized protein n=1 Tax=Streptomyces yangpuensis TaxID=1648182 RepID=A0ABY5Q2V4_9ACTN|nr:MULTISPECIES: hypothetical protein [Streptomyces]UUY49970.1 hypothetical protein NRK68_23710 [Streptomyces yangpuensis]